VAPGGYTLIARAPDGALGQKLIRVPDLPEPFDPDTYEPASDGDYDVVLAGAKHKEDV